MTNDNRFSKEEIALIIKETISFNAEHKSCVGRVLSKKRAKGIKIDKQAIAIALKECGQSKESKMSGPSWKPIISRKRPVIRL